MINKDNNLNIDILRQQNANIPLKEASSQNEEPHQLGNRKSEGNLYNSASKDNNIGAMLKKDVEKLSTLVSKRSPRNEDWKCQHDIQLNFVKNLLRNFPAENLSEQGSALLHESYLLIKNVLHLTENVNTIDGKLKDPDKILTLHNSVRKTLANVAHNTTGSSAMAMTKGTLTHAIASLDSSVPEDIQATEINSSLFSMLIQKQKKAMSGSSASNSNAPEMRSSATSSTLTASSSSEFKSDKYICSDIADLMSVLGSDYLEIYANSVEIMSAYWQDFSEHIQSNMGKWTHSNKKGDAIIFDVNAFQKALMHFYYIDKYPNGDFHYHYNPDYVLYPPAPADKIGVPLEEAEKWCAALGLPVIPPDPKHRTPSPIVEVEPQGSGLYVIIPNPQIIDSMSQSSDSMVHRDNKGKEKNISKEFTGYEISTAEYQAWLAGYNGQAENMKTDVQVITTKYSTANSTYDTIIKLLSSTITALFDAAKDYLRF